jgi:hypothetical protein
MYYDVRRDNIFDAPFTTDYWATTTDGIRFTGDRHLAGPFDLTTAPNARGLFVGDYEGLAAAGHTFVAVFATTNCSGTSCADNATDIYRAGFPAQSGNQPGEDNRSAAAGVNPPAPAKPRTAH